MTVRLSAREKRPSQGQVRMPVVVAPIASQGPSASQGPGGSRGQAAVVVVSETADAALLDQQVEHRVDRVLAAHLCYLRQPLPLKLLVPRGAHPDDQDPLRAADVVEQVLPAPGRVSVGADRRAPVSSSGRIPVRVAQAAAQRAA